jgi:hypothetical protein
MDFIVQRRVSEGYHTTDFGRTYGMKAPVAIVDGWIVIAEKRTLSALVSGAVVR